MGRSIVAFAGVAAGVGLSAFGASFSPDQIAYFEKHIRPVLVDTCYECHSNESGKSKGGLLLDSRDHVLEGGETSPAVVPGDPEASLLMQAIRYEDEDLQMPPEKAGGRMPESVIAAFEEWIRMGAPDPRDEAPLAKARDMSVADRHWSFQPLEKPALPELEGEDKEWVRNEIDVFVMAKLREEGIEPSEPADKRTLLRRLSYDLTGLPPTPEEVEAFVADSSPFAYAREVERLLASPAYGERWGRHWLDVARYADSKGRQGRFPYSYSYRDYVIRAFNEDKPYDRFVLEQLAADQLDLGEDNRDLAAMGFLTLGRTFMGRTDLIIDDQIDVVTRGLQGLTVTCSRCHDHKSDPIPMEDYYSLHGIFASSKTPETLPLIEEASSPEAYEDYLSERAKLESAIEEKRNKMIDDFIAGERAKTGDYLMAVEEGRSIADAEAFNVFAGARKLRPEMLRLWIDYLEIESNRFHPALRPWFQELDTGIERSNVPQSLVAAFEADTRGDAAVIYNEASALTAKGAAGADGALMAFFEESGSPANPDRDAVGRWFGRKIRQDSGRMTGQLAALEWEHSGAPTRAHTLEDISQPQDSPVYKRGDPANPGAIAPRQYLEIVSGAGRKLFKQGSGRLEMAREIIRETNPLTARVFVNRVWGWRFGRGFVDTPSDFGTETDEPIHSELLDWLAASFMENGWSIKELHRKMVLSNTYQQSSSVDSELAAVDPENRLWHRFPRRRLDLESMRDTFLAVSGTLDRSLGGRPVSIADPQTRRRTIYSFLDRQDMPGIFQTFDLPSPEASSPKRFETVVPQQALYLMNSPFANERSRELAERVRREGGDSPEEWISSLYKTLYQREPSHSELEDGLAFARLTAEMERPVESAPPSKGKGKAKPKHVEPLDEWALYAQALLLSNELMFVD